MNRCMGMRNGRIFSNAFKTAEFYLLLVPIPLISRPRTKPIINPIFTFLIIQPTPKPINSKVNKLILRRIVFFITCVWVKQSSWLII